MVYDPEHDGSAEDAAAGFRTIGDVVRPVVERSAGEQEGSARLLRPIRTEADARAAVIRSRLLSSVNALFAAGAIDREIVGELIAAIEGATA